MGRLPKDLEEKRLRLMGAVRRGAFESYVRHGRVPDVYDRIAEAVGEAKAVNTDFSLDALAPVTRPAGRPTTHYVWCTAGDNRVRGEHAARNGQVFAWNDPPEHGHPGREPNCRCWPEPYYGDPALPDALLTMVPGRRVNTDPGVLWASIDKTTRPDGSLAASKVVLNDGTVIDSSFAGTSVERTVSLPDASAVSFERDGTNWSLALSNGGNPLQVAWAGRAVFPGFMVPPAQGPEPLVFPDLTPDGLIPIQGVVSRQLLILHGAAVLYNMLVAAPEASGGGISDVPAMAFGAWDYNNSDGTVAPVLVGTLTQEQVAQLCKRLPEVQAWTDEAAALYGPDRWFLGPQRFGVNVHLFVKLRVEAVRASGTGGDLLAEYSVDPGLPPLVPGVYGQPGTTRLDVIEYRPDLGMACVYDIKTGDAHLAGPRVAQMAAVVYTHFGLVRFVIIEVKPGDGAL